MEYGLSKKIEAAFAEREDLFAGMVNTDGDARVQSTAGVIRQSNVGNMGNMSFLWQCVEFADLSKTEVSHSHYDYELFAAGLVYFCEQEQSYSYSIYIITKTFCIKIMVHDLALFSQTQKLTFMLPGNRNFYADLK